MKKFLQFTLVTGLVLVLANGFAVAASMDQNSAASQERIVREVHHQLAMIPWVTVFDDLSYQVEGNTVTLMGEVRNPVIKDEALSAVKHIEGVEKVNNQIEVLPVSFNDNRIRLQVARAIFHEPRLFEYAVQPVAPIHIIVKNGHVDLEGVVRNQGDKDVAGIRANEVPGVFSVQNDLKVEKTNS